MTRAPRRWLDPTGAGMALGIVLLASFVVAGRGIGASGAFAAAAGRTLDAVAPAATAADPALADRIPSGVALIDDWIVLQLVGLCLGAAWSAWQAGRLRRGSGNASGARLLRALAGGALMGVGARLAYGCTSGLALSGGALLATGAWIFIPIAFGTAFLVTALARDPALARP
ncbi:MAG TPA: YeeE/YedE thiosulfate transporter family protein [Gemmatimonadaceae bacterium]|nr:YeeE/YedE thiosulfate transporter family protein [Gemmatimonadaceae bacterium]